MSQRKAIIALSVAMSHFCGSLAFSAPSQITIRAGISTSHHGLLHQHRHRHPALVVAAKSEGGHDDWIIDEVEVDGNGSDKILHASEKSSVKTAPVTDDDDDQKGPSDDIRTYFATCIPGLQETLASELIALGANHVETQGKSGVRFEGSPKVGLKSILWCRTAHKIMELIASSSEPPRIDNFDDDFDYESDFSRGIRNRDDLYQFTKSAAHTPTLLGDGFGGLLTLSVSTIYASKAPNKELCHGHFTALTVKNALVDAVRDLRDGGDRPDVDVGDPDVPLVVVIKGRRVGGDKRSEWRDRRGKSRFEESYENDDFVADVDLYRVLHSGSLHRRGYRQASLDSGSWEDEDDDYRGDRPQGEAPIHKAAMKETLAAGLLLEAGWDKLVSAARGDGKGAVLVDPMTGSATLPTEAALIACDMAPGLSRIASWRGGSHDRNQHRLPPCTRWKDFSTAEVWEELLAKATQRAKTGMKWAQSSSEIEGHANVKILCNEMNPRAYSLARTSIRNASVRSIVSLSEGDCIDWNLGGGDPTDDRKVVVGRTIFVCNPPWGLRLTEDIDESWVSLREFLRREAGGCESWVLSGNKQLTRILRMKKSRTVVVKTADEDLRWLQYHIFERREVPAE